MGSWIDHGALRLSRLREPDPTVPAAGRRVSTVLPFHVFDRRYRFIERLQSAPRCPDVAGGVLVLVGGR